jgi:hypothetical protein
MNDMTPSIDELNSRLEEFLDATEEQQVIRDEGVENIFSFQQDSAALLPESSSIHDLTYEQLVQFSRCLIDSLLMPRPNIILLDNQMFWGWVAAVTSSRSSSMDKFRTPIDDFYLMVHLCLLSKRQNMLDSRISNFMQSMNKSLAGVEGAGYDLASTMGFSVLEGLVRRHCDILTQDGNLDREPISEPSWRYQEVESPSYYDELQIWLNIESSEYVRDSLSDIDDFSRYESSHLEEKIESGDGEIADYDNLLYFISQQRHSNVHGELSTRVIGPVIITLCSLVLLDTMTEDEFEEAKESALQNIESNMGQAPTPTHPRWPIAFYPI